MRALQVGERRTSEVGVQQDAGGVDDRLQQRAGDGDRFGACAIRVARGDGPRAASTSSGCGNPQSTSDRASASTDGGPPLPAAVASSLTASQCTSAVSTQ